MLTRGRQYSVHSDFFREDRQDPTAEGVGGRRLGAGGGAVLPDVLVQGVFKVVLQKSIPTQIRQHILYTSNSEG